MARKIRKRHIIICCFSMLMGWFILIYCVFSRQISTKISKKQSSSTLRSQHITPTIPQMLLSPILSRYSSRHICSYHPEHLPSIIWSNHAKYGNNEHDGSTVAVSKLMSEGICNFDIDISIVPHHLISLIGSRFIVGNPTVLIDSIKLNDYQTVESFLMQVMHCMDPLYFSSGMSRHVDPFVTLEPKFDNISDILSLLETVDTSVMGKTGHAAVIVRDMVTLHAVQEFYKERWRKYEDGTHRLHGREAPIPVAVAFHSTPSPGRINPDIPWPVPSILIPGAAPPMLPRHLDISVRTFTPGSFSAPLIRQINMPDVHLLLPASRLGHAPYKFTRNGDTNADPVVAWVVDTEDMMWRALDAGADAVISNRPIELLHILRTKYAELCEARL